MSGRSLRFRLWAAAAISILAALAIAGVGLGFLFERHVERRVETELGAHLSLLIGATRIVDGDLRVGTGPADPRFNRPLSGLYWQVEDVTGGGVVRSRSLWDSRLDLPADAEVDGAMHSREVTGPDGALLFAVDRVITEANGASFRAVVAEDHRTIENALSEFVGELTPALLVLAVALIAANFVQITVGLAPLESLRRAVRGVIARNSTRLDAQAPQEVQPLAAEINRLLDAQEKALARARTRATDLAHGLNTPLQVLSADIRALRQRGESKLADDIERSTAAIRRHVERELARARLAPGVYGGARCRVAEVAQGVVSVAARTPRGEMLEFAVDIDPDFDAPIDEGDLSEILGNLIENAVRFAPSRVALTAGKKQTETAIIVTDDGPGIADADREAVTSRGVRLDSGGSGTGLGLAIVSDIVEAYGGRLEMSDAAPGLRVRVVLPNRDAPPSD